MVLNELVSFSNLYGSNEELVLAGGGNTSAKDGNVMYIKGSGTRLADITAEGFVKMDREKIAEIFTKTYPDNDKEREALSLADLMAAKLPGQENKRPSVETTLHSLFPHKSFSAMTFCGLSPQSPATLLQSIALISLMNTSLPTARMQICSFLQITVFLLLITPPRDWVRSSMQLCQKSVAVLKLSLISL